MEPERFTEVDHLVLNEAETTLSVFLEDFSKGQARHLYPSNRLPEMEETTAPRWSLIDHRDYASMCAILARLPL